jgi:predicted DNA-binding transcriptional regulator AlpA
MENERVIIATDRKTLKEVLNEMFSPKSERNDLPDFEGDRISKPQAAKLAGISIPTLDRQIKLGKFKQHKVGKRCFFMKSEIIESLRNNG